MHSKKIFCNSSCCGDCCAKKTALFDSMRKFSEQEFERKERYIKSLAREVMRENK